MKTDFEILIGSLIIITGISVSIGIVSLLLAFVKNLTGSMLPIFSACIIVIAFFAMYRPRFRELENRAREKKETTPKTPQSCV